MSKTVTAALLFILCFGCFDLIFLMWGGALWNGCYSGQEVLWIFLWNQAGIGEIFSKLGHTSALRDTDACFISRHLLSFHLCFFCCPLELSKADKYQHLACWNRWTFCVCFPSCGMYQQSLSTTGGCNSCWKALLVALRLMGQLVLDAQTSPFSPVSPWPHLC